MEILETLTFQDPNDDGDVRVLKFRCSCGTVSHGTEEEVQGKIVQSCGHERTRMDPRYFVPKLTMFNRHLRCRDTAYYLWEKAGRPPGDGKDFWCAAQKEVNMLFPEDKK